MELQGVPPKVAKRFVRTVQYICHPSIESHSHVTLPSSTQTVVEEGSVAHRNAPQRREAHPSGGPTNEVRHSRLRPYRYSQLTREHPPYFKYMIIHTYTLSLLSIRTPSSVDLLARGLR